MTNLQMTLQDQDLICTSSPIIASGDVKTDTLTVTFDDAWDGLTTSAVFKTSLSDTVYEVIMTSGSCNIPSEVLAESCFLFIGIRGVNASTGKVKTSNLVKYKIVEGSPKGTGSSVDPTPDVYQQLLSLYTVLNARLNTLVPSGTQTEGNTELIDIRTGADNQTYTSAGNAVRSQVNNLNSIKADKTALASTDNKLAVTNKKLENLIKASKGIVYDTESDDDVEITKDVPQGAMPFATIDEIGGKSVVLNQLVDKTKISATTTLYGVTVTNNNDGSITLSGTNTHSDILYFYVVQNYMEWKSNHTYYVRQCNDTNAIIYDGESADGVSGIVKPQSAVSKNRKDLRIKISANATFNNLKFYPLVVDLTQMFGSGNEPTLDECKAMFTDYIPYNAGEIKHAAVDKVVSRGRNLYNFKDISQITGTVDETDKSITFSPQTIDDKPLYKNFKPNTRYTIILKGYNTSSASRLVNLQIKYTDGTTEYLLFDGLGGGTKRTCVYTNTKSIELLSGLWGAESTKLYYEECGIFEGVITETEFSPYKSTDFPIPQAVQNLEGYGWGINDECFNYADYEEKKFHKIVGKYTFTGDERWTDYGSVLVCEKQVEKGQMPLLYKTDIDLSINWANSQYNTFQVSKGSYDVTTIKTYTKDKTIFYKLATEHILDISDKLTENDTFIEVESGGTITFHQAAPMMPVPSKETYMIKVGDVL